MNPAAECAVEASPDLNLLLEWERPWDRPRRVRAGAASALLHVLLLLAVPFVPGGGPPPRDATEIQAQLRRATPLIAPPPMFQLTQPDPNRGALSKEIDLESLLPRPKLVAPRTGTPAPPGPPLAAVPAPKPTPPPMLPQAPKIELPAGPVAQLPPQGIGQSSLPPPPPPQIQAEEKPRIAFESVRSQGPTGTGNAAGSPSGRLQVPTTRVDEIASNVGRTRGSSGLVVSDMPGGAGGGMTEGINLPPAPGKIGSSVELLSDPQGVDFRPYLIKVLSAVRRNWFAVIPESARYGRQGRVVIQFAISRDGSVPKLVIASPSGADALDRAAVAGISASNPFPPLPAEFRGDLVRLQFSFSYNMPRR